MKELEEDSGQTRQGVGPSHFIFEKTDGSTKISRTDESPTSYAEQIIAESKKRAKRVDLS